MRAQDEEVLFDNTTDCYPGKAYLGNKNDALNNCRPACPQRARRSQRKPASSETPSVRVNPK